jgi:putative ABC transport system permease protein
MGLKVLFKNVYKSFFNKKFQLLAVAIIIFLASFIYTTMFLTTSSLQVKVDEYSTDYDIEDFSISTLEFLTSDEISQLNPTILTTDFNFTLTQLRKIDYQTYNSLINKRINDIEETYISNYRLMLREGKDLTFGSYSLRAYFNSNDINKTYLETGRFPVNDDEVCLNKTFLKNHDLEIDDQVIFDDVEYTIVGEVLFVDYSLAMIDNQMLIDMENSGVILFTDDELENVKGQEFRYLSGLYENEKQFQKEVVDEFNDKPLDFVSSITLTKNQIRSGAIIEEINGGQAMTLGLAIMISLLAVLTVAIITYKMLNSEKQQIGLLKAIGYKNIEITIPYIIMLTIISLPMLLVGYFVGIKSAYNMKSLFLSIYMLPDTIIETDFMVLVTAILVPFVFIIGLSYLIIKHMLDKTALSLLKNNDNSKTTKLSRFTNNLLKNTKATTRFKYSYLTQSLGKLVVFIIGIVSASLLLVMTLMVYGFSDRMIGDFYASKEYQYEAIVDFSKELPVLYDDQEKVLDVQVFIEDNAVMVKGLDVDNKLYRIYDNNKDITEQLNQGAIINKALALELGLKNKDNISLRFQDKEINTKIVEISDNGSSATLYFQRNLLGELYGNEELYSGVYSKNMLSDEYKVVISKQNILDQAESMNGFMNIAIGLMIGTSLLISILILYILTTLTVEDNYYSISLLKVIGYSKKEIRKMILSVYLTYSVLAYLISIPITILIMNFGVAFLSSYYNMYISLDFGIIKAAIGLIFIILIYLFGSFHADKELRNIPLQEVLKEYQE